MKKYVFYFLLVNFIFSVFVVVGNFPDYIRPFENIFILLNDKYRNGDVFIIKNKEEYSSIKNRTSKTVILSGALNNGSKSKIVLGSDEYMRYMYSNNKLKVIRNSLNNDLFIEELKGSFIFDNLIKIYFFLVFILISIFIIPKIFKNK